MAQRTASGSAGSLSSCVIGSYLHTRRCRLGFRQCGCRWNFDAAARKDRPSLTGRVATTVVCAPAEGAHPARGAQSAVSARYEGGASRDIPTYSATFLVGRETGGGSLGAVSPSRMSVVATA
jgi:hypothetical protein